MLIASSTILGMETIFDLPAHPLMVHFPVVAIPAVAVLGVVFAFRPHFRERYGGAVLVLAAVTTIATFMAVRSGEALAEAIEIKDEAIDPHRNLGNALRWLVLGLTTSLAALGFVSKRSTSPARNSAVLGTSAVVVIFSVLALVWTIRTGHEGAKSVWEGVIATEAGDAAEPVEAPTATTPSETDAPTTAAPTTSPPSTTDVETSTASETAPSTETTAASTAAIEGREIYEANCARCHSADGSGGRGPSFQGIAVDEPDTSLAIEQTTSGGGGMPAFGARLDEAEIIAVVDYIYATF